MKTILFLMLAILSTLSFAEDKYGNLDAADQKYYQNDVRQGRNAVERTDSLVREVNKLIGENMQLKQEIQRLRADVDELKAAKK